MRRPPGDYGPNKSHRAIVNEINPSEKSPSGTDFACQRSWILPRRQSRGGCGSDIWLTIADRDKGLDRLPISGDL